MKKWELARYLIDAKKCVDSMHHLIDKEKCRMTEHRFGTFTGKYLIYRGLETSVKGVQYINVEKYLTM